MFQHLCPDWPQTATSSPLEVLGFASSVQSLNETNVFSFTFKCDMHYILNIILTFRDTNKKADQGVIFIWRRRG